MNLRSFSLAIFSLVFFLALPAAGQSAQTSTARVNASTSMSPEEQELIGAAHARANAFASGHCEKWATFVDADFRDIEGKSTTTQRGSGGVSGGSTPNSRPQDRKAGAGFLRPVRGQRRVGGLPL